MPIFIIWLLIPWALDIWLTVMLADTLDISAWFFFVMPALAGFVLLAWEWRRIQTYWQTLRRFEGGSLWALLGSIRRVLAAFLLILPGIGSACIGVLLLLFGCGATTTDFSSRHQTSPPYRERYPRDSSSAETIEGEFRRTDDR
ncbi:MAG: FxsA family protein [Burkholderiales bacterium]|jgi:UPF0716 family protein affecting phage T7 exclusion|nr:FxsA family protein [Burkholderiales bacterium]